MRRLCIGLRTATRKTKRETQLTKMSPFATPVHRTSGPRAIKHFLDFSAPKRHLHFSYRRYAFMYGYAHYICYTPSLLSPDARIAGNLWRERSLTSVHLDFPPVKGTPHSDGGVAFALLCNYPFAGSLAGNYSKISLCIHRTKGRRFRT